jgi:hypothetical protein
LLPINIVFHTCWVGLFEPVAKISKWSKGTHVKSFWWKIDIIYKVNHGTMKMLHKLRKGIWFISYFCAAEDYIDGEALFSLSTSPHIFVIYNSSFICFSCVFYACIKIANKTFFFSTENGKRKFLFASSLALISLSTFMVKIYFTRYFTAKQNERKKKNLARKLRCLCYRNNLFIEAVICIHQTL